MFCLYLHFRLVNITIEQQKTLPVKVWLEAAWQPAGYFHCVCVSCMKKCVKSLLLDTVSGVTNLSLTVWYCDYAYLVGSYTNQWKLNVNEVQMNLLPTGETCGCTLSSFDGELEICVQNYSNIQKVKNIYFKVYFFLSEFPKYFYNINAFLPLKKKAHFSCQKARNNIQSVVFLYLHRSNNQYISDCLRCGHSNTFGWQCIYYQCNISCYKNKLLSFTLLYLSTINVPSINQEIWFYPLVDWNFNSQL